MMATYEAAVYVMTTYYCPNDAVFYEDTEDRYEWYLLPILYYMVSFNLLNVQVLLPWV